MENERADAGRDGRTCQARPSSQARTGTGKYSLLPIQLTTSRIGNHIYYSANHVCMVITIYILRSIVLRYGRTTACSGMPERDGKDQGEDSPKQTGSCWFARPCWLATSGANLCPPGLCFADVMTSFSGVRFVLFCFVFRLYAFVEAAALRSIVLRYASAPIATRVFFLFLETSLFPSIFLHHFRFLFALWRVRRTSTFFPSEWCFSTL